MSKLLVYATAVFFMVYGGLFLLLPTGMVYWITGADLNTASAVIDLRATYGGAQLSIGLMMLLVVKLKDDVELGLIFVAVVLLAMAFGRLVGLWNDGEANLVMYLYLAGELLFGALALVLRNKDKIKG
ncbi:DUF4345 family protein [Vibrio sp. D404a]|uniref:DUF4345 domain-containing protein n=1 Tax=unclassified Vibrio TaxID=2614977 RepID=UPI00255231B0|nr:MULTISPECIES: DUF4345 domain-containing protein [unclassified Vibrio]MDK9736413.1 DUF4345 family protein [Vibrio sp. D404a]MDK9796035.1 DUF4345 family protein [Vibrio sp. D449a]